MFDFPWLAENTKMAWRTLPIESISTTDWAIFGMHESVDGDEEVTGQRGLDYHPPRCTKCPFGLAVIPNVFFLRALRVSIPRLSILLTRQQLASTYNEAATLCIRLTTDGPD